MAGGLLYRRYLETANMRKLTIVGSLVVMIVTLASELLVSADTGVAEGQTYIQVDTQSE